MRTAQISKIPLILSWLTRARCANASSVAAKSFPLRFFNLRS